MVSVGIVGVVQIRSLCVPRVREDVEETSFADEDEDEDDRGGLGVAKETDLTLVESALSVANLPTTFFSKLTLPVSSADGVAVVVAVCTNPDSPLDRNLNMFGK